MEQEQTGVETNTQDAPTEEAQGQELNTEEGSQDVEYYQNLVKKLQEERDNYKKMGLKYKKDAKSEEPQQEEVDEDRLATLVAKLAEEKFESYKNELVVDAVEEGVQKLSNNPGEQELIRYHYDNTIKKSGHSRSAVLKDLKMAKALANPALYEAENTELKEALKSKSTTPSTPSFTGQKPKQKKTGHENYSGDELKLIKWAESRAAQMTNHNPAQIAKAMINKSK